MSAISSFLMVLRVALARLRFVAVFVIAMLVVGYWDTIKNHVDKWTRPPVAPDALAAVSDVEYYCVMHPNVIRAQPGNCPICGMPLAKRKKGEKIVLPDGVLSRVQLTPYRIALANIQTTTVEERPLVREIRAAAVLDYDETRVAQLSARVAGRADELFVKSVGQSVKRGDKVYSLYSPELYTAQREYLLARKRVNDMPRDAADELRHDAVEVYNAAMQKLVLWGTTQSDLDALDAAFDKTGQVPTHFVVTSPISGIVVRKNLFEGGYVSAGDTPYTVADESNLWLQARIYEDDVPLVKLGQQVEVSVEGLPNKTFAGKITFLAYQLDPVTRTLAARVEIPNPDLTLRPGMFADGLIRVPVLPEAGSQQPVATSQRTAELERAQAFRAALEPYFAVQKTLADDRTDKITEDLHTMVGKLASLKSDPELAPRIDTVMKLVHESKAPPSTDVEAYRELFRQVSAEVIEIGKTVGIPAGGDTIKIYHCPMGKKPNWLQPTGDTVNPYMGKKMLTCGGPLETLPKRTAPVPTRPATTGNKLLAVPRSSVIDTGSRKIVFVENPQMEGAFDMRQVTLGPLAKGDWYPVLSGLEPNDKVVTTGAFLLDAENRLNPLPTAESATAPATQQAPIAHKH